MKNKKISISKLLFMISNIVVVAAIIKIICQACFPSFLYTPFYKIIEILEAISENYMLTIAISYMIIYLFATQKSKSQNQYMKTTIFIVCLMILSLFIFMLLHNYSDAYGTLLWIILVCIYVPVFPISFVYIICYLFMNRGNDKTENVEVAINENKVIANDNQVSTNENQAVNNENQISTSENPLIPNNDKEDNQITSENQ